MEMFKYINKVEGGIDGIKINCVWADDKYDVILCLSARPLEPSGDVFLLWLPTG
jgi:hypothetical protein